MSTEMRNQGTRTDIEKTKTERHKHATHNNISFMNQQERNAMFNSVRKADYFSEENQISPYNTDQNKDQLKS